MTSSMMKVPPTIGTCLFGPSSIPPSIISSYYTEDVTNDNNEESKDSDKDAPSVAVESEVTLTKGESDLNKENNTTDTTTTEETIQSIDTTTDCNNTDTPITAEPSATESEVKENDSCGDSVTVSTFQTIPKSLTSSGTDEADLLTTDDNVSASITPTASQDTDAHENNNDQVEEDVDISMVTNNGISKLNLTETSHDTSIMEEDEESSDNDNNDEKEKTPMITNSPTKQHELPSLLDKEYDNEEKEEIMNSTPPQSPVKAALPSRPAKSSSNTQQKQNSQPKINAASSISSSSTKDDTKTNNTTTKPSSTSSTSSSSPSHVINLQELRRLTAQGIPDASSHRPIAWRILLGYLPLDTSQWQTVLDRDRSLYRSLVEETFVFPSDQPYTLEGKELRGKGWRREEISTKKKPERPPSVDRIDSNDGDNHRDVLVKDSYSMESATSGEYGISSRGSILEQSRQAQTCEVEEQGVEVLSVKRNGIYDPKYSSPTKSSSDSNGRDKRKSPLTDEERRAHLDKAISAVSPNNQDAEDAEKKSKLIPANVKEMWRRSGKDLAALYAGVGETPRSRCCSGKFLNALLISEDDYVQEDPSDVIRTVDSTTSSIGEDSLDDVDPKWAQIFDNASLLDEIRKDVVRTHPELQFFLTQENNLGYRRYSALERILFVWAKLNKGVRYVQGMNEIVGTMYFVLANDTNEEWSYEAEADTYFLFNTLMVEMRDIFVPDLDDADTGIQGRMSNMIALLSLHDPEVRCHLDDCGIDPAFYSIRWLTTLLSREFHLADTIRLWDSMFASTHKDNFMRYVCVSMVMIIREDLLKGDFGTCLRLLQKYPPTNIDGLLESSRALWIYESQVTLACHKGGISLPQALTTIAPPPAVVMAYGLNGGMALDEMERRRIHAEQQEQKNRRKSRSSKSSSRSSQVGVGSAGGTQERRSLSSSWFFGSGGKRRNSKR